MHCKQLSVLLRSVNGLGKCKWILGVQTPAYDCLLGVKAVFCFIEYGALRAINDARCNFLAAVSGQAVQKYSVFCRLVHKRVINLMAH